MGNKAWYFFVDHMCYLCLVFFMLSCLFIAALWSPAGKGLTSWLLLVMFSCVFVTFPCGILGQQWYLIVLIPDLCSLSYFDFFHVYHQLGDDKPSRCYTPCESYAH